MKHSRITFLFAFAAGALSQRLSTDGSCGPTNGGATCVSTCCSQYGWCGSTPLHCGTGCNPAYGDCGAPGQNSAPPPANLPVNQQRTPDGSCGGVNGFTCAGNPQGQCCSQYGWCGAGPAYCNGGCQNGFGLCSTPPNPVSSAVVVAPSSGPVASSALAQSSAAAAQSSANAAVSSQAAAASSAVAASSAGASSVFGSSAAAVASSSGLASSVSPSVLLPSASSGASSVVPSSAAASSVAPSSVIAASSSAVVASSASASSAAASLLPMGTYCGTNYNTEGNGTGNDFIDRFDIVDPELCCQACNQQTNCVANAIQDSHCVLLVRSSLDGGNGQPTAQCPLEQTVYPFVNPGFGIVYKGPCGLVPQ